MKLRNKKTGEIKGASEVLDMKQKDGVLYKYYSLAELNEEWEDYEEPKENYHWFISGRGTIEYEKDADDEFNRGHKSLGNYFESNEEAEKAVKNLRPGNG